MAEQIRVLVADDDEPLRTALCDLMTEQPDLEVVAVAADARAAVELAKSEQPDVALLDIRMGGGGGPQAAREIAIISPDTRVLGLSAYEDRASVIEMLSAGAVGYLVKGVLADEIVDAIRRAARGQASLSVPMTTGVIEQLVGDIAERRQAEDVLRRSETQFRDLLESAPDAAVIVDDRGRIVLVNGQAERMFGYTRDQLLGRPVETLLPERVHGRHEGHRDGYLEDPRTRPMGVGLELAGRRRDGSEFPVDISLSAIETEDGTLATAFIRDITQRKLSEELRRKSEDRFAALLESAPDAVVIVDSRGRIVLVNQQTENLFGYERDDLLGETIELLLPGQLRERHVGHRDGYLASPRTRPMGVGLELAGRRRDGSEFPVDISLAALETEEGRLVTAFVRDISERRVQAELRQTLESRSALVAGLVRAAEEERRRIASDIHDDSIQVISAVGMRLQMLRRRLSDPADLTQLQQLEETIQLAIGRLRNLLFELRPPALDREGLAAALRVYLWEAKQQSGIPHELSDRLHSEPAEEGRVILYRIAQEAMTNARKHAQAAQVDVTLLEQDGGYLVRITDDGVGFVADDAVPVPGHLGLAAMRERAEQAGGWFRIESAHAAGTTVEGWIPATVGVEAPA